MANERSTFQKTMARLRGEVALALIRTFTARGIAALGSVVLVAVLGRLYGAAGVGVFALAQSLIMAISLLGCYGMNNALLRFVGRDLQAPNVFAYLWYACIKTFLISTALALALFLTRGLWAQFFSTPELPPVLIGIAIAAPAFTLSTVIAGFMKAVRKPVTGLLLQNGAIAGLAAALVVLLQRLVLPVAGLTNIGIAYAVAAWLLLGVGILLGWLWFRSDPRTEGNKRLTQAAVRAFNRSSSAFFAIAIAQFMITVLGIWIAGYFLATSDVGLFKAAQQVAMLIGVVLMVINAVLPPRFAAMCHAEDWRGLERLARQGALLGVALAIGPAFICLVAPLWVLQLFGNGFSGAVAPLYVLAVAQLISVSCGSVGFVLNMAGHEPLGRNIAWTANTLGVIAMLVLAPHWGVVGVALGVAIAMTLQNLVGVYFVWRRLGIWTLPVPNVLNWVGVAAGETGHASWKLNQ